MTTTNLCRCGHPADYHRWRPESRANGALLSIPYCVGQSRINEAHPDYEPCACTSYRPRLEPQGRML